MGNVLFFNSLILICIKCKKNHFFVGLGQFAKIIIKFERNCWGKKPAQALHSADTIMWFGFQ